MFLLLKSKERKLKQEKIFTKLKINNYFYINAFIVEIGRPKDTP